MLIIFFVFQDHTSSYTVFVSGGFLFTFLVLFFPFSTIQLSTEEMASRGFSYIDEACKQLYSTGRHEIFRIKTLNGYRKNIQRCLKVNLEGIQNGDIRHMSMYLWFDDAPKEKYRCSQITCTNSSIVTKRRSIAAFVDDLVHQAELVWPDGTRKVRVEIYY